MIYSLIISYLTILLRQRLLVVMEVIQPHTYWDNDVRFYNLSSFEILAILETMTWDIIYIWSKPRCV